MSYKAQQTEMISENKSECLILTPQKINKVVLLSRVNQGVWEECGRGKRKPQ